ncbi:hypothetical protein B7463_g4549, partial [Scytalidium lignicola]
MATPTAEQFTLFLQLPFELRRTIWMECLPRRVIELKAPERFDGELTSACKLNARPPIITQVCRESRKVALENGGNLKNDLNDLQCNPLYHVDYQWFCPVSDIFHANWITAWCFNYDVEESAISYFLSLASRAKATPAISARAIWDFLYGVRLDNGETSRSFEFDLELLETRNEYLLTVMEICVYADINQAARSGLFGRLVEERIKLIHALDKETIRKYHQLWSLGTQYDMAAEKCFEVALSTELQGYIEEWNNNMDKAWLCIKEGQAAERGDADIENHQDIWIEAEWQPLSDTSEYSQLPSKTPNKDHLWTRKVLENRPQFTPMILFRLCERKDCWLRNERVTPRDMIFGEQRYGVI